MSFVSTMSGPVPLVQIPVGSPLQETAVLTSNVVQRPVYRSARSVPNAAVRPTVVPIERRVLSVVSAGSDVEESVIVTETPVISSLLIDDGTGEHPGERAPGDLAFTEDVFSNHNELKQDSNSPEMREFVKNVATQQKADEERYFREGRVCPVNRMKQLRDRLGTLKSDEFRRLLRDQFYNSELMLAAMCVTESITRPPVDPGDVESNIRIKRWFQDLKRIGAESVEGFAMESDLDKTKDAFIIKSPRKSVNPVILHEYFVGVYGLNQVRKIVPNFAYIMGGFKCSMPIIDDNKQVIAWCNDNEDSIDYVIYENIAPSKTLAEIIKETHEFEMWLNYYMQILYALNTAHKMADYTHFDLHTENVLARDVPQGAGGKEFAIEYETERGIEYLITNRVATVIDYGLSHIKYNGEHFGVGDRIPWGVLPDASFPMHDAYKLLLMSMRDMQSNGKHDMLKRATQILRFFNDTEPVDLILTEQRKTYYYLPYTDLSASYGFLDLTKYIRENIPEANNFMVDAITQGEHVTILACSNNDCIDSAEFLSRIGLNADPSVSTVFDFYDLVSRKNQESDTLEVERIKREFDWKHAKRRGIRDYNAAIDKLGALLRGGKYGDTSVSKLVITRLYTKDMPSIDILFATSALRSYKTYIFRIAEIYDTMQRANVLHQALIYTGLSFGDTELAKTIEESYDQVKLDVNSEWKIILDFINQDINYTRFLMANDKDRKLINERLSTSKEFNWWWRNLPEIAQIIAKPL
jgi:hypothetical protein